MNLCLIIAFGVKNGKYYLLYIVQSGKNVHILYRLPERLKILYVGSLSDRKNVVEMFQVLCQKVELELGIVGDGEKRAQIEEMNIQSKTEVTLYGIQPMERVSEIMQQYDVLILPSKHDGWGLL